MLFRNSKHALLSLAIIGLLGSASFDASAQRGERGRSAAKAEVEVRYPQATRTNPDAKGSPRAQPLMKKLVDAYEKDEHDAVLAQAQEIFALSTATDYDRAVAAQLASQAAYGKDDIAGTIAYLQQAIEYDVLDNNNHFQLMYMQAGLQLQEDQIDAGLATLESFFTGSGSQKPEEIALKGQALYQAERFEEAIPVLRQAIESSQEPRENWQQLLMASYAETGRTSEAVQMAEGIALRAPQDKRAQLNLATVYLQSDQFEKAAEVLERVRGSGQMDEERDYRQLYTTYANLDGKEREAISVILEGMEKGLLQPDHQTYLALAQSYYYTDQIGPAIDAWQKAAPLGKDGETYLNLAKVLWQEDRGAEAKTAARAALDKGLRNPEEARKIIAAP